MSGVMTQRAREQMHWLLRNAVVHPNGQTLGEAIVDGLDPEPDDDMAGTIYQAFDKLADTALTREEEVRGEERERCARIAEMHDHRGDIAPAIRGRGAGGGELPQGSKAE